MNVYFVVEGNCSELRIYPQWISYALPFLKRVKKPELAANDSYYMLSGGGYPRVLQETEDAVATINSLDCFYDYLVVVVDSENESVIEREQEIQRVWQRTPLRRPTNPIVIVQHRCIETWLLGNRRMLTRQPGTPEYAAFLNFYDVADNDPELMNKPKAYAGSVASYHESYLKQVFSHRNTSYSKRYPGDAAKEHYWNELKGRYRETGHLQSFARLCSFFEEVTSFHQ